MQIYIIRIDLLETLLDILIRVAEHSYAFKTWAGISINMTLRKIYVIGIVLLENFLDVLKRVDE